MKKKEQLLWDTFRAHAPSFMWPQRIENLLGDGMPDVYIGCSGKWVELKAPSRAPVKASTPLLGREGLRQSQINWHLKLAATPRAPKSFVLVRTFEHDLFLLPGGAAEAINSWTVAGMHGAAIATTWTDIMAALS